jgi:hypothetical protein
MHLTTSEPTPSVLFAGLDRCPQGKMKHLQLVAGRIYNLLKKEAAHSPNTQHLEDFRAAQKLERSLDGRADHDPTVQSRFDLPRPQSAEREAR